MSPGGEKWVEVGETPGLRRANGRSLDPSPKGGEWRAWYARTGTRAARARRPAAGLSRRHPARARRQGSAGHPRPAPRARWHGRAPADWSSPPTRAVPAALPAGRLGADPGASSWRCPRSTSSAAACSGCCVGHADDVELDSAGRILVPPALRRYASLDHEVVLVGQGRKFEVWDEAQWAAQTARTRRVPGRRPAAGPRGLEPLTDVEHVPSCSTKPSRRWRCAPDGTYVDGTFGRGGHARAILAALGPRGRLVALDRDPAAADAAAALDGSDASFSAARGSPRSPTCSTSSASRTVDGVLLDLGVSSPQLDDASRGFSYRFDGPLDMRMDPTRGETAAAFLARADVRELTEVIRDYGEERFAQSVARAIAAARAVEPIATTRQLAGVVGKAVGARTRGDWRQDPAARTFQALRIAVNRELDEVSAALPVIAARLAPGGRLAVISFHSLEDRIVKRFIAAASAPFGGDPRLARLPIRGRDLPARAARRGRRRDQGRRRRARAQSALAQRRAARRRAHRRAAARRLAARPAQRDAREHRPAARARRAARCRSSRRATRRGACSSSSSASRRRRASTRPSTASCQLEQSTWGMPARVEKIAREELRMQLPRPGSRRDRRAAAEPSR